MKQGRLTVGVLGSQIVGIALAQALQRAGHLVIAITEADSDSEEKLSVLLPTAELVGKEKLLSTVELVILALDGEQLQREIEQLALAKAFRGGQLVIHTAAEFGYELLQPATMLGAIPIAITPAMRFTGTSLDMNRIAESCFAISAPNVALPIAQALVIEMGAEPLVIDAQARASFVEAIEVAGNFSAMIVNQAIGLLQQAGVSNPQAVIAPVVRSAVEQALSQGHQKIKPEDLLGDS